MKHEAINSLKEEIKNLQVEAIHVELSAHASSKTAIRGDYDDDTEQTLLDIEDKIEAIQQDIEDLEGL